VRRAWQLLVGLFFAGSAVADVNNDGFVVVPVNLATQELRLFWQDEQGQPLRRLDRLAASSRAQGRRLVFGMNAGMFHADGRPVGLLVIDGREVAPLNLSSGEGNFFLKPNGVFVIDVHGARVIDAVDYPAVHDGVRLATQSGPLLLSQGRIHPGLRAGSASRYIRNGVCVVGGQALFVITERPISLYDFASYFRDALHCTEALYLDGSVSSLYAPALNRQDRMHDLGPLFGVLE